MRKFLIIMTLWITLLQANWDKSTYPLSADPIDVVIPCAPKDRETLELCINACAEHAQNIRRILVVSKERMTSSAEWFDEANFPFSKQEVALEIFRGNRESADKFLNDPESRVGWIYQQLLKLYAPLIIPNISSNVLVLDADLIFLRPIAFTNSSGGPLFTLGFPYECVPAYVDHAKRLLPGFQRVNIHHSGIAHHMLFQKPILENLFNDIVQEHHAEPWKAICRCIDPNELFACLSEYEIYFNYALRKTSQARFRQLRHIDLTSLHALEWYRRSGYDFAACHAWRRAS